ncbi:MAG: toll/interleukin-1 receptor domain-containing protein, partial [Planctomycetaceae bacterium]
ARRQPADGVSVFIASPTPDARGQADHKAVIESVKQIKQWPVRVLAPPEIFVSFAWGDDQTPAGVQRQETVDRLCQKLEERGFLVRRDSSEIRYGSVISEYMKRLGRADRVLVILSEKYLRSPYCMSELHAIYQRSQGDQQEFLNRVIPVSLDDARFSSPEERVEHARSWYARHEKLKADRDFLGDDDQRLLTDMKRWSQDIGNMLAFINDTLTPRRFEDICRDDFLALRELVQSSPDGEPLDDPLGQSTLFVQVLGETGSKPSTQRPFGLEGEQFLKARQAGVPCLRWRPKDLDLETLRGRHPQYVNYLSGAADPQDLPPEERVQAGYLPDFQKLIEATLIKLVARRSKGQGPIETLVDQAVAPVNQPAPSAADYERATESLQQIQQFAATLPGSTTATPAASRPSLLFAPQQVDEELATALDRQVRQSFGQNVATEVASAEYPLRAVYEDERGLLVIYGKGSLDWVQERVRECRDIALDRPRNAPVCALYLGPPDGKPPLKKRPPMMRVIRHDDPQALRDYLAELQAAGGDPA